MKNLLSFVIILTCSIINAQENDNSYFSFHKGGKKYLKPIKYVLFNPYKDNNKKKNYNGYLFFYIQGERFKFSKKKYKIDTCSINYLSKIKLEQASELAKKEYQFHRKKIKEDNYWKEKMLEPPMPLTELHPYFRIVIIEKYMKNKIIKYEVDWDYSGTRGLHVKEQ